jgi:hypothetical protein
MDAQKIPRILAVQTWMKTCKQLPSKAIKKKAFKELNKAHVAVLGPAP